MLDSLFAFLFPASPSILQPFELKLPDTELVFQVVSTPALQAETFAPALEAKAALVMDVDSGKMLYTKNIKDPLPMASLTKIMTAILILENHDLQEMVTVQSHFPGLEGVRIWLQEGEKLTVEDLLKALLIPSAGDAAMALAEFHSGTAEKFVEEMNKRAIVLGLNHTHFQNPVGLDAENHYSNAYEMALLTQHALRFPEFRRIVGLSSATIHSTDGAHTYELTSTNRLFGSYLNVEGVKTGTTDEAGESLITLVRRADGREILTVLLNSPDRFQEAKSASDWAMRSFVWE